MGKPPLLIIGNYLHLNPQNPLRMNATTILGASLIIAGAILTTTIIGAIIGVPMIIIGILLIFARGTLGTLWKLIKSPFN